MNLKEKDVRVFHDRNTDKLDSYTILVEDNYLYAMSSEPNHPQYGYNQFIGELENLRIKWDLDAFGEEIELSETPDTLKDAIRERIK